MIEKADQPRRQGVRSIEQVPCLFHFFVIPNERSLPPGSTRLHGSEVDFFDRVSGYLIEVGYGLKTKLLIIIESNFAKS